MICLTTLNGFAKIRKCSQEDVGSDTIDPHTLIETCTVEWDRPHGKMGARVKERGHLIQELATMWPQTGLEVENMWGGTAGNWARRNVELDEIEIMVVAKES